LNILLLQAAVVAVVMTEQAAVREGFQRRL
jgi:hypothetical protein